MAQVRRIFWGRMQGRVRCTFTSRAIHRQSIVLVTASEGQEPVNSLAPDRYVGDADIIVHNIAPFGYVDPYGGTPPEGGGVRFVVTVYWHEPLPIWTDIVILDEIPRGFII